MYINKDYTHNHEQLKLESSNWVLQFFRSGDIALTLTFREHPKQNTIGYIPNYNEYAKHIHHYLNSVNRTFLGLDYTKRGKKLNVVYVFEFNNSNGLHVHMLLEAPPDSRIPKKLHLTHLRKLWAKMKCTGIYEATDVTVTYDVHGWVKYIFKDLKYNGEASSQFMLSDWHLSQRLNLSLTK